MRKEYDFANAKPNPYVKNLRKQGSIRIDIDAVDRNNTAEVNAVGAGVKAVYSKNGRKNAARSLFR